MPVVALVEAVKPHPDAQTLSVCTVNGGKALGSVQVMPTLTLTLTPTLTLVLTLTLVQSLTLILTLPLPLPLPLTLTLTLIQDRLAARRITLRLADDALDALTDLGYSPAYGARPLKRVVQSELETPLARALLAQAGRALQFIPCAMLCLAPCLTLCFTQCLPTCLPARLSTCRRSRTATRSSSSPTPARASSRCVCWRRKRRPRRSRFVLLSALRDTEREAAH